MCCFSPVSAATGWLSWFRKSPPVHVADTRIFGQLDGAWQGLVYSMALSVSGEVAMILPLPVAPGSGEDAVTFVDLSGYPRFFEDMAEGFVMLPPASMAKSRSLPLAIPRQTLKVHKVGSFEASYVPSLRDFDRLDARFRLPDAVWQDLPAVADFGFAVFKLQPGKEQHIHPMAFRFLTRDAKAVFFPTLHIHDGAVHPTADFDHELYTQHAGAPGWESRSWGKASAFMKPALTAGLVDGERPIWRRVVKGRAENRDTWMAPPAAG